ncbi:hypothetical protein D0867_03578 [Hortaea werneckii]|uniref:EF-hand domain-containing protein n=1 Tax=Hortaea werneckii TaxID=91943 RepID=A0A3M7A0R6_HORWE|nr:hypothetical protein D0867_03578 [Hortaea werneckii]
MPSQGTLERLSSAQLLDGVTVVQLQRSQQLTGNPIKERFGNALYNFFIIYPGVQSRAGLSKVRRAASEAVLGRLQRRQRLSAASFTPSSIRLDFLDDTAVSFLGRAGRAPKPRPALHPDDAAKVVLNNFGITETHVLHALEYTHGHGKRVDYDEFKTWMMKQPKQHREIFKWLTKRVQVFIQRCGGPSFWLEAGYKARQEVVYDMIHEFPGHITTNIFSTLAEAFSYAQTWGTDNVTDLVKEFRALIVY